MSTTVTGLGKRNLTGYSVVEDATPLDASSTEGGVGTISFALPEDENSLQYFDTDIELADDFRGTTAGIVTGVSINSGINSITADSRVGPLVGVAQALPITGTFEAVARYYLSLGSIVDDIYFDSSIASKRVNAPGWNDDAWLKLKQLCMVNGVEITLVSNKIVFRPVRSFTTNIQHKTDFTVSLASTSMARAVEVTTYDNTWLDGHLVYPRTPDEIAGEQVYTIEAGAVLEDDIELSASLASVVQPVCVDDVAVAYDGTVSVYSVRGSDNSLITPQSWTAMGGKIELTINPDTTSLHMKITASSDQYYGPYRIAGRMKEVIDPTTIIVGPGQQPDPKSTTTSPNKTVTGTNTTVYPAAKDDYPWPTSPVDGMSPLGYSYRDCTDFVMWRLNRDAGRKSSPWKYTWGNVRKTNGDAIGWKHDWELNGWKTGIKPVPGAIAWFGTSAGSQGHVAYVQKVTAKQVALEDYNWGTPKQKYHLHYMDITSVDSFLANPNGAIGTTTNKTQPTGGEDGDDKTKTSDPPVNPADSETDYASLRIVGTGALINKNIVTIPTGAPENRTATAVGITVENPFVSDIDDAYRVGVYTGSRYKGEEQTVSGTLTFVNQRAVTGSIQYPTIGQFNYAYAGKTIADFNNAWRGKTLGDFDAAQRATVIDTFENQVFGNVAGARFRYNDAFYRIVTGTTTNSEVEFTATRDTMIQDFNNAHAGKTIADFNAQYAGMSLKQFGRVPLQGG